MDKSSEVVLPNITVYVPRGNYQLLCKKIEPDGIGSLEDLNN